MLRSYKFDFGGYQLELFWFISWNFLRLSFEIFKIISSNFYWGYQWIIVGLSIGIFMGLSVGAIDVYELDFCWFSVLIFEIIRCGISWKVYSINLILFRIISKNYYDFLSMNLQSLSVKIWSGDYQLEVSLSWGWIFYDF